MTGERAYLSREAELDGRYGKLPRLRLRFWRSRRLFPPTIPLQEPHA